MITILVTIRKLFEKSLGEHIQSRLFKKDIAGGPDIPAGFYTIISIVWKISPR